MWRRESDGAESSVSEPTDDLLRHLTSIALAEGSRTGLQRHDAEDIAQMSLMRFRKFWKSSKEPQAYIRVVARRLSRELFRSQAKAAQRLERLRALSPTPLSQSGGDRLWGLRFAVRKLEPPERELFQMLAEGLSGHEIAWQLGCREGAARVRVHRLRQKLRLLL